MTWQASPEMESFIVLAQEITRKAYADEDPHGLTQWIVTQLGKLGGHTADEAVLTWAQSIELYAQVMAERKARLSIPETERKNMLWAWASWNKLIDPLEPGLLALLSAGDGQGKTAYAETQAEHWARAGFNVVFCHWELNKIVMLDRRAARQTGIPRRQLKTAELDAEQEHEIAAMLEVLPTWPGGITYVHTPGWTADRTIQTLRALQAQGLCDVVIIDYLEKIPASTVQLKTFGGNAFAVEANNVERFKDFAEMAGLPVLMLAQMNKAGKNADFATLDRTAIRGAGEKSEKSNVVVLIHRERDGDDYSPIVNVRIDKNTLGPTGSFKQMMNPPRFRVLDMLEVKR